MTLFYDLISLFIDLFLIFPVWWTVYIYIYQGICFWNFGVVSVNVLQRCMPYVVLYMYIWFACCLVSLQQGWISARLLSLPLTTHPQVQQNCVSAALLMFYACLALGCSRFFWYYMYSQGILISPIPWFDFGWFIPKSLCPLWKTCCSLSVQWTYPHNF